MSQMDHSELAVRLEKRLDKIEEKLDKHLELVAQHKVELEWTKGYIRVSIALFTTLIGGTAASLFRLFIA